MGLGDDILASGVAAKLHGQHGEPVTIGRSRTRRHESLMYENIPWINNGNGGVLLRDWVGHRGYVDYRASRNESRRWVLHEDYRAQKGVLRFSESELWRGDTLMDGKRHVVVEPHVKGSFSGDNKRWPWEHWLALVGLLRARGDHVVQVSVPGEATIPGVDFRIAESSVRVALSCLRWADPLITTDGLMHHAAAALNVPAVVLWGSRTDPKILGYTTQENVSTGPPYCGARRACTHCEESMMKITPEMVMEAMA